MAKVYLYQLFEEDLLEETHLFWKESDALEMETKYYESKIEEHNELWNNKIKEIKERLTGEVKTISDYGIYHVEINNKIIPIIDFYNEYFNNNSYNENIGELKKELPSDLIVWINGVGNTYTPDMYKELHNYLKYIISIYNGEIPDKNLSIDVYKHLSERNQTYVEINKMEIF